MPLQYYDLKCKCCQANWKRYTLYEAIEHAIESDLPEEYNLVEKKPVLIAYEALLNTKTDEALRMLEQVLYPNGGGNPAKFLLKKSAA